MGPFEGAVIRVMPSGRVQIATGATSQGQGHWTTYAQIASDALGVPFEKIEVIGGDTAMIPFGVRRRCRFCVFAPLMRAHAREALAPS
jgi:aerobic carbon-monoxide dehydrogenase large subunit